jgi:hypothetical protein
MLTCLQQTTVSILTRPLLKLIENVYTFKKGHVTTESSGQSPTTYKIENIVALSLSFNKIEIARAPVLFCRLHDEYMPHYYKILSSHVQIRGYFHFCLLS